MLGLEHERTRWAHADAVAAVDAGGVGQRDVELGGDVGVETPSGRGDGEGVLGVLPAGLDALVTEDAALLIAYIEVILDLWPLCHGGDVTPVPHS